MNALDAFYEMVKDNNGWTLDKTVVNIATLLTCSVDIIIIYVIMALIHLRMYADQH